MTTDFKHPTEVKMTEIELMRKRFEEYLKQEEEKKQKQQEKFYEDETA